jgi:N-sulfoglucosamine sulfohydrolase
LAIKWPGQSSGGQVVDDFVCLPDLAPTFLQAAGVGVPSVMTGRSLVPVIQAGKSGMIDPTRDHVIVGRERHVAKARVGNLPYPQRAIRTADYLYIRNFKPDRYPMGLAPSFGLPDGPWPPYQQLRENTFVAFGDLDASPTKAWMLTNRSQPSVHQQVELTMELRPAEELFDVRADPHHMHNLADNPSFDAIKEQLAQRLMNTLELTGDPRVADDGTAYDKPPYVQAE